MSLDELYQELILDHGRGPRNFGSVPNPTHDAAGKNPLCGDHLSLSLEIEDDIVKDVKFSGSGCLLSVAAASMMTEAIQGKTIKEASNLCCAFCNAITNKQDCDSCDIGELAVLTGVKRFPQRIKCATLPWRTLEAALNEPS